MATRKKSQKKAEPIDISARLAESLSERSKSEKHSAAETPQVGDRVTVDGSTTVWTVSSVSYSGREVNLSIPGTNLERFRVPIDDLNFEGRVPRKPKEPPKPKMDVEAIRERIEETGHSILDHLQGELAALKKFIRSKGLSAVEALDEFAESTEAGWKEAIEAIEDKLEE
ncbi:hypothetical protein [Edaphobacter albus]|uniref:hypothetical protein n=1 Tax=Edaphobacter sp. 4G125 TaxID=2763071 RepID=UPI001647524E|nr:hypothetical protein [Edaphobacter sp. 4G125]QNI36870.1 hypothetical protein H7846_00550 [Edaphobacter sp. 4G125]